MTEVAAPSLPAAPGPSPGVAEASATSRGRRLVEALAGPYRIATVTATLQSVQPSAPIAIPTTVAVGALVLVLVLVLARVGYVLLRPRQAALEPESGAAH